MAGARVFAKLELDATRAEIHACTLFHRFHRDVARCRVLGKGATAAGLTSRLMLCSPTLKNSERSVARYRSVML
jgi:hypothetical protein